MRTDTRIKQHSPDAEKVMNLARLQTNMAYILADVADSYARDCLHNLKLIGKSFVQQEKRKWKEVERLMKLLDTNLRALAFNGYDTSEGEDYIESSDKLYDITLLLCDRAGGSMETIEEIYNTIAEKFPSKLHLIREDSHKH